MSGFRPYDPNSGSGTAGVASVTGSTVDNTDPLNPVVDAIAPAPTDATYAAQGDQWVNAVTISTSNMYTWSDDTAATDPGLQAVKINNADESLATEIYINETTLSGGSIQALGEELVIGDLIRIQQYGATGNFITFSVSAIPTDNGDWWTIPVAVAENSGGFVAGVDVGLDYWPTGERGVTEARVNNTNGYGLYYDSATETLPQEFDDGVTQQLVNDKAVIQENLPNGVTEFFDSTTNLFMPDQIDGIYGFKISFIADAASRDKLVQIMVYSPNAVSPGIDLMLERRTNRLAKSDNTENFISIYFAWAADAAIVANGVRVDLMFEGTDADVHDVVFQLDKLNAPLLP